MEITSTLAARAYAANRIATEPDTTAPPGHTIFSSASAAIGDALRHSEATAVRAMTT